MLMNARNLQFTWFQKLIGVWLFANSASYETYAVLGRIGLSVSYTTVLKSLRQLSVSKKIHLHAQAIARCFLLLYDNINRMIRVWDPELGQRDVMDNGTAAAYVVLEDCDPVKAFNVEALEKAQAQQRRKELSVDVLYNRVDWTKLTGTMAVHCLGFLLQEVPDLEGVKAFIAKRLESTDFLVIHRMRKGRQTEIHPLATSNFNEGTTAGNQDVIDDLILHQLKLKKEDFDKILTIIGGDQSTIEKIRTLKKFLQDCSHGYRA